MDQLPETRQEGITVLQIEQKITEITNLIGSISHDQNETINIGLRLYQLIESLSIEDFDEELMNRLTPEQVLQAQFLSLKFETTLDNRFMDDAIAGKVINPDEHPLQSMYNLLGLREGTEIKKCLGRDFRKPLIHIGSGYAETAIAIFRQFGIPVICIEREQQVAEKVERTLDHFNLLGKEKIRIKYSLGQEILPEGDAVIISAMVPNSDKSIIIENMRHLAYGNPDEPLLVLRTPSKPTFSLEYPILLDDNQASQWMLRKIGDTKPYLTSREPLRSQVYTVLEMADVRRGFDRIPKETAEKLKPVTS